MAHFHELETKEEIPGYFGEVFNPFGYYSFVTDPNRDYSEKGEHFLVASTVISAPLFLGAAFSGGGASMPMWFGMGLPAWRHRAMGAIAFKRDLVHGAMRGAFQGLKGAVQRYPGLFAAAAVGFGAYLANEFYADVTPFRGIMDLEPRLYT